MSADAWPYELRKAIVGYNQCVRAAKVSGREVEADGRYVENFDVPPHKCRWCYRDLIVHRQAILCPNCDRP